MTRRLLSPILMLGATVALACSPSPGSQNDLHADAERRWHVADVDSYTYELWLICECLVYSGIAITVEDGDITAAAWIQTPPEGAPEVPPARTIDDLFAEIDAGLARRPAHVEAEYDAELGYPIRILLDYEDEVADEEFAFRVENFSPL